MEKNIGAVTQVVVARGSAGKQRWMGILPKGQRYSIVFSICLYET
jgi:hypothetical protein